MLSWSSVSPPICVSGACIGYILLTMTSSISFRNFTQGSAFFLGEL